MSKTVVDRYKEEITAHANEIAEIHDRVRRNFRLRNISCEAHRAWRDAAAELRTRYDGLAFPGGAGTATKRVRAGKPDAMEAAVCFLELRPYFFRSGYMFKDILRVCRHAPLSEEQQVRLSNVEQRYRLWQKQKRQQTIQLDS